MEDRVVHKYQFDLEKRETELRIDLPFDAKVVAFQEQRGVPTFWVERPAHPVPAGRIRVYRLVGTGHLIDYDSGDSPVEKPAPKHLGTAQFSGGDLVLHLYEWK
jgi:hypothetical protein